ncbi:hypothetical protein HOU03_gp049 [Caulobacter phage CcrSC]|uniref:Uncharacterized protein n=1 Tax=Caulobacter phage CcrSC TaxID=2283272 RepID=A0A385ECM7_9CAUD|nr:hypothetical protein HOU03_gp049 [Caulobacter phage CcrSC]AXQ69631.1 hypothetical protein CcrSC_gp049c [Caulobacter phage CcrSC]
MDAQIDWRKRLPLETRIKAAELRYQAHLEDEMAAQHERKAQALRRDADMVEMTAVKRLKREARA